MRNKRTILLLLLLPLLTMRCSCDDCEGNWPRYTFTDKDKEWMAPYTEGKVFSYVSANGERLVYRVTSVTEQTKKYESQRNSSQFGCNSKGYFYENIDYQINNNPTDQGINFQKNGDWCKWSTSLRLGQNILSSYLNTYFIDQNESSFSDNEDVSHKVSNGSFKVFYLSSITIDGKKYERVYKCQSGKSNQYFYYVKEYAIVRIDDNEQTWKLEN
jgi:hypothetical protein